MVSTHLHLGPLLFLLYINDLINSINITPQLFAEDTCIIANAPSPAVLEQTLNLEMAGLSMWINANKLTVNAAKSYALIISPNFCAVCSSGTVKTETEKISM